MVNSPVIIVGASVAGASCALQLARAGVRSTVLERRRRALDKVCGEGLQPAGAAALGALLADLDEGAARFSGFRIHLSQGAAPLEWDFPTGVQGLGLHRGRLEARLWRALADDPLIELRTGTAVRGVEPASGGFRLDTDAGELSAGHVACANGVRSDLRGTSRGTSGRFGARARFEAPSGARVAVHYGAGLEAYVTPVAPELVSVALLGTEARIRDATGAAFEHTLEALGALPRGPRVGPVQMWPHVGPRGLCTSRKGVFFCGDAALALDPISGAGMTLATLSGALLGRELARTLDGAALAESERRYDRDFRRAARPYRELTRFLRLVAISGVFRRGVERALRARPDWIAHLARPLLAPPREAIRSQDKIRRQSAIRSQDRFS